MTTPSPLHEYYPSPEAAAIACHAWALIQPAEQDDVWRESSEPYNMIAWAWGDSQGVDFDAEPDAWKLAFFKTLDELFVD